jgi:hypothetical protein
MKYRKKPVVIDAMEWNGIDHRGMFEFLGGGSGNFLQAVGDNFFIDHSKVEGGLVIKTLEGKHLASIGDFIIKGIAGEYYPCKPDIFHKTYDAVDD